MNPEIVERVNRGEIPFAESDLSVAVSGAVTMGRLRAQREMPPADAYVIAVPTPFTGDHKADLSYITAAAEAVAEVLHGGEVIVLESTAPPGRTGGVSELIAARRPDLHLPHVPHVPHVPPDVHVAHCPERMLPGRIMIEIATNDRAIGGLTPACAARRRALPDVLARQADRHRRVERRWPSSPRTLPRRQHRLCQRAVADLPAPWPGRRGDPPDGPLPSAGGDPAAGAGRRRALHRRRPVVHRGISPRPGAAHPHGPRRQRPRARAHRGADRRYLPPVPRSPDRLSRAVVQADVGDLR